MDVAESHLAGGGYLGVSLEEVAKEVGVSKPALYYHFPEGKEELFVEIVHRSLRHIREGLERAMAGPEDGAGKLREAARWLMAGEDRVEHMGELRGVANFVAEQHQAGMAEGFYGSLYMPIRRTISAALESGEFRNNDPDFLTWAFLGIAAGMMDVQHVPSGLPALAAAVGEDGQTADRMVDLFLEGALA